jgi:hypothetical protein
VTAFEHSKRSADRGAVSALQYMQHGSQNLGKLPRSGRNRGIGTRDLIFELRYGPQGIVDTQLDEAPPSAHELSVWGKPVASRFQRAELRAWSGIRVPDRADAVQTMTRGTSRARVQVQRSGIVPLDHGER